jgi:hypothetical protein
LTTVQRIDNTTMADNNLSNFIHLNSDLICEIRRDVEYTNRVDYNYYNPANQTQLENKIKTYIDEKCIMHDNNWNYYVYNVFDAKRPKDIDIEPIIRQATRELEDIIRYDTDFDKINWTKIEKKDSNQLKTIKLFFKLNYNNDK